MYVCNLAEDIAPAHPACHCGLLGQSRYAPLTGSSEPVPTHTYIHTYLLYILMQAFLGLEKYVDAVHPPPMDDQRYIELMAYRQVVISNAYIHVHTYIHGYDMICGQPIKLSNPNRTSTLLELSLKYTYIPAYIHTYIHTYMHTYMHTYIHTNMGSKNVMTTE